MAETSEGYLFIGDGNQRYVQRLRVSDGNGDGEVVIAFNTRYAGLADSEIPTDKSIFEIADQPGVENSSKDAVSVRPLDSQTLNQLGVNETLAQPIQPNQSATSYPLATAPTGSISVKQGELIIRDRKVTTQLRLVDPSLKNARLMVAPRARADADDLTPLLTEIATPLASDDSLNSAGQLIFDGGQIALNERIVFQANLTGVFGTIQEGDDFGQTQDLSLSIVQTNPGPNRSAITIIPTDAGTNLFVDPDNNTIAFVVDTWRVDVSDDQNVPTLEEILTDSIANNEDFQIVLSIGSSNPYFEGGGIVANFTFVERRASFDNTTEVIEDGRPVDYLLLNSSRVRISGTATVAPGTELTVRAEEQTGGSGVPLFKQNTTVVQPGGTWATVLTFEDISNGTDFFLTVRDEQATRLRQIRGLIGIDIGNETDAPRVVPDGEPTTNVDDDPQHEDIDGDESFTIFDVSAFLAHYGDPAVQNNSELFNFDGQGGVDIFDVAALLEEV